MMKRPGGGATRPKMQQQRPVMGDPMNGVGGGFGGGRLQGGGKRPGGFPGQGVGGGMGGGRMNNRGQGGDNGFGAPRGQQGYGDDATYKMLGGQMTVGNKSGARSWLGSPTMAADNEFNTFGGEGVLAPMGMGRNGFMQHGYVPGARNPGEAGYNVMGLGTGYAMEGMDRAGMTSNQGWDPRGQANTQAWGQMQGAIGKQRPRRTRTFGDVM